MTFTRQGQQRGFTMIELLVVLVILGMLAGLVGPRLFGKLDSSKAGAVETQVKMLKGALQTYRLDVGSYPSTQDGLEALVRQPSPGARSGAGRAPISTTRCHWIPGKILSCTRVSPAVCRNSACILTARTVSPGARVWMRISATYPTPRARSDGFTLLEIMVVLVLLTLITSLVAPRLGTLYQALVLREQRDDLILQVQGLPYRAFRTGREFHLGSADAAGVPPLDVPEGWVMDSDEPVVVKASGVCTGGTLELTHEDGERWAYRVEPPFCRMSLLEDDG
jgi:prepilin-type N-terminal cleavage/methylation domain-containing protein